MKLVYFLGFQLFCTVIYVECRHIIALGKIPIEDPGDPLFLTPLIRAGKIREAQNASRVPGMKNITSFSGYITVNEQFNSNMFFWFFPSRSDYRNDPVLLWLQGGPGISSLFGLFVENGPFEARRKDGLKLRKYSWADNHSVIYIDNPVGTGFSFTDPGSYSRNETVIGENLYECLLQFFQLFPELQKNDFYVTGESYGGKYVPAISYTIHKKNLEAQQKINLKGLAIGNGLSDPIHQLGYGDYFSMIGLIDDHIRTDFNNLERQAIDYIKNNQWLNAAKVFANMFDFNSSTNGLFNKVTGFIDYYNFLYTDETGDKGYYDLYVQRDEVRAALHVGNLTYLNSSKIVETEMMADLMQSVAPWISELLSHYKVMTYNGQLDLICPYPLTVNYLKNLNFTGAQEYKNATRYQWHVDNDIAGYVKQAGNLTEVLVRDAGHMVPLDQPKWALDLITRFTRNKSFH